MKPKKRRKGKLRYGLLAEVRDAFSDAIAMQGAGDPEWIDFERARLRALEREVVGLLKKVPAKRRRRARHKVGHEREEAVRQARH